HGNVGCRGIKAPTDRQLQADTRWYRDAVIGIESDSTGSVGTDQRRIENRLGRGWIENRSVRGSGPRIRQRIERGTVRIMQKWQGRTWREHNRRQYLVRSHARA